MLVGLVNFCSAAMQIPKWTEICLYAMYYICKYIFYLRAFVCLKIAKAWIYLKKIVIVFVIVIVIVFVIVVGTLDFAVLVRK